MQVAHAHPAQLGRPDTGQVRDLRHHGITAGDQVLPGVRRILTPAAEEVPQRRLRGRDPQTDITAMTRLVEHVDGRLDGSAETAHDLAGAALFEEREVRVDLVETIRRP
ncbi:hypothetical protein ABZ733_17660 [Streptomyces longwoodensis]